MRTEVTSRYSYDHPSSIKSCEETAVLLRLMRELKEAPDLHIWIDRLEVVFHPDNTAHTEVFFNPDLRPRQCFSSESDCGCSWQTVPLQSIHFDPEKWRRIFRQQALKTMTQLMLAAFLGHTDIEPVISEFNAKFPRLPDGRRLTLAIADA